MLSPDAAAPAHSRSAPDPRPTRGDCGATADVLRCDLLAASLGVGDDTPLADLLERLLVGPARDVVARPSKHVRARLVETAWTLCGGVGAVSPALPRLVELVHAGSLIVDDIQDGSTTRRGAPALHVRIGLPLALNAGNWLYFLPLQLLAAAALPPDVELAVYRRATAAMARCHAGQAFDLGLRVDALRQADVPVAVRTSTSLKTGTLAELATSLGAVAAGAAPDLERALGRFGRQFGVALQMLDDLGNLRASGDAARRAEDVRLGRATWPWAWAAERMPAHRFAELQRRATRVIAGAEPADDLARRLAARVEATGRRRARRLLDDALETLGRRVGRTPALAALAAEIDRLVVSYG